MTQKIILAIIEIFGLFLIGGIARRLNYIKDSEVDRWSRLTLDIFLPMFTFSTILNGVDRGAIKELWIWPAIGLGQVLFATTMGFILQYGLHGKDAVRRRTFLHFCAFNNYTYLPVIIFRNLWGEESLSMLFLMGVGSALGVWTIGVAVLNASNVKSAVKNVVTPNLVSIIAALIIALTVGKSAIPDLLMHVISRAGSIAIPLILILIGSSLMKKGYLRITWPVVWISVVRLVILPFFSIMILKMLPLPRHIFEAAVIVVLMPIAVATVFMTRRYGGHPDYAASGAVITTLLSMITVPVAVWLLF